MFHVKLKLLYLKPRIKDFQSINQLWQNQLRCILGQMSLGKFSNKIPEIFHFEHHHTYLKKSNEIIFLKRAMLNLVFAMYQNLAPKLID